jgi:outer membrane receptor protein involved in Fe transport
MSQLFNPMNGVSTLSPETGRTAELGVRSAVLDDTLNVELSYWDTQIDDIIFFDYSVVNLRATRVCAFNPALTCGQYNNGAEGKTSGVEVKAEYALSSIVGLYGNYTYTDSQTRAVGAQWKRTVQIADHKANVGVNFKSDKLTLGSNVYYSGPRLRWAGDLETAGYVRVDVSGRYAITKGVSLFGRIENLLDDDYLDELGYAETGRYGIFGAEWRFF